MFKAVPIQKSMLNEQEYNVCNLYPDGNRPSDYYERLESTYTKNWIDIFHRDYQKITIDNNWGLDIIKQAYSIGKHTKKVSKGFLEELEIIAEILKKQMKFRLGEKDENSIKYFVRAENVSLKTGIHKTGPYTSILQVLESLITCNVEHSPIIENAQGTINPITLYFLPWVEIDLEFRVFVYNSKITGISQQHWYEVKYVEGNNFSYKNKYEKFVDRVPELIEFCNKTIKLLEKWVNHHPGFTMDIALLKSGEFYFIEVNGFGAEYSAGSSLFHWRRDNLENPTGPLEYRYLVDQKEYLDKYSYWNLFPRNT
jgi:hypothetical protein